MDSQQPRRAARVFFTAFHSLHGHFDHTEMDSGGGRIGLRVGFGWIRVDHWTPKLESANPTYHLLTVPRSVADRVYDGGVAGVAWRDIEGVLRG